MNQVYITRLIKFWLHRTVNNIHRLPLEHLHFDLSIITKLSQDGSLMALTTYDRLRCKVLNGAVAGVVGVSTIFPLDLVKTRMQNQNKAAGGAQYRNLFHCFKSIVKYDGFTGLYRGIAVNLFLSIPEKAIKLVVNDEVRHYFMQKTGLKSISVTQEVISGAAAGACHVIVTSPMELMKINLQLSSKLPGTKVTAECLFKHLGIRGIYKGLSTTAMRDISFSVIYFPTFSKGSEFFINPDDAGLTKFFKTLCIAMASGAVAAGSVTPFDVVKTRVQTVVPGIQAKLYKGMVDCTRDIVQNEGAAALFKGCVPRMAVIAPLFAIVQSVYFLGVAETIFNVKSLY